jgi:hypothetical protein
MRSRCRSIRIPWSRCRRTSKSSLSRGRRGASLWRGAFLFWWPERLHHRGHRGHRELRRRNAGHGFNTGSQGTQGSQGSQVSGGSQGGSCHGMPRRSLVWGWSFLGGTTRGVARRWDFSIGSSLLSRSRRWVARNSRFRRREALCAALRRPEWPVFPASPVLQLP